MSNLINITENTKNNYLYGLLRKLIELINAGIYMCHILVYLKRFPFCKRFQSLLEKLSIKLCVLIVGIFHVSVQSDKNCTGLKAFMEK